MDPDFAAVAVAGLLAVLGARRRRRAGPGSPTLGQEIAERGQAVSTGGAKLLRQVGSTTTSVTVGTGEVAIAGTSLLAAGLARAAARATTEASAFGVATAGRAATGAAGLLVDGMLGVRDGVATALRGGRRSPSDASQAC